MPIKEYPFEWDVNGEKLSGTISKLPKIIITKGISGSGKSTWAKGMVQQLPEEYRRVNKDTIREMLGNDLLDKPHKHEGLVLKVRDETIDMLLSQGYSVIVDDTNIHPKHEQTIRHKFGHRADIEVKMFHVDLAEAIARDLNRPKSVGEKVIRQQFKQLCQENEVKVKQVEWDYTIARSAIICDLDGTLCLFNDRSPYDASSCENDLPNKPVVELLTAMYRLGYEILFVSGREDKFREPTINWLKKHVGPIYTALWMRPTGDFRKDVIVKEEIYRDNIQGVFNILMVVDDRNQVVEFWRKIGLTCFQVAEGEF